MSEHQETEVLSFDGGMSAEKARYAGKTAKRLFSKLLEQQGKLIICLLYTSHRQTFRAPHPDAL